MDEERLPPLNFSPTFRTLIIKFWSIVISLCAIFFLIGLAIPINKREQHPDPPLWPESVVYEQEIIEEASYNVADFSTIFYHWPSRSWWANHTNLFNSHCYADLLWLGRTMWTVFPAGGEPYGNLSCCINAVGIFANLSVHPPDWLKGHWYVGEQEMYGVECQVFYSTTMASTLWVAKNSSRTPMRWDNNSGVEQGGGSQLITSKFENFRVGPLDMSIFNVPPACANNPPICPPYASLVDECRRIWNITG